MNGPGVTTTQRKRGARALACLIIAGSALGLNGCAAGQPSGQPGAESGNVVETVVENESTAEGELPNDANLITTGEIPSTGGSENYDATAAPNSANSSDTPEVTLAGVTKSITDPDSDWVLVNKHNPLPRNYAPTDLVTPDMPRKGEHQQLRAVAAKALMEMSRAADLAIGKPLQLVSGYRSYADQKEIYDRYVAKDGQEDADTYSARPGYSEHQTGLAADLSTFGGKMEKFGETKLGEWTAENAWKYGFILRYTPENHNAVGYQSEPWHYRYVGLKLAKYYHDNDIVTLEQALNQPAAPDYR